MCLLEHRQGTHFPIYAIEAAGNVTADIISTTQHLGIQWHQKGPIQVNIQCIYKQIFYEYIFQLRCTLYSSEYNLACLQYKPLHYEQMLVSS